MRGLRVVVLAGWWVVACKGEGGTTEGSSTGSGVTVATDVSAGTSSSATTGQGSGGTSDVTTTSGTSDVTTTSGPTSASSGGCPDTGCGGSETATTGWLPPPCPDPAALCGNGEIDYDCQEECDLGAENDDAGPCTSACRGAICGDGLLHAGVEQCDDGNDEPDDACANHCGNPFVYTPPRLVAGLTHVCALSAAGKVRCWGADGNKNGVLGYGSTQTIGDGPGEMPPPDVALGGAVVQIAAGHSHTCALLVGGAVRCWGFAGTGALGYGNKENLGDEPGEMPPPDVDVGGAAVQISAGEFGSCALLATGAVRCWGAHFPDEIGDEPGEMPPPDVEVGGAVAQIHSNRDRSCVLRDNGSVACWFTDFKPVPVVYGGFVVELAGNVCARLATGALRCVGYNDYGQKGFPDDFYIGDAIVAGDVPVGGAVKRVAPGDYHTCAVLASGKVRCWGMNASGELGYGDTVDRGFKPGDLPTADLVLGGAALEIAAASGHSCATLVGGKIKCWGAGGRLGTGNTEALGDEPGEMPPPDAPVF